MRLRLFFLFSFIVVLVSSSLCQGIFVQEYFDDEKELLRETYYIKDSIQKSLHGEYTLYFYNQNIKINGYFKNNKEDGPWVYYFESGKIKKKGTWKKGQLHGHWKNYYENGSLKQEGYFEQGRKNGAWTYYYENGKKKSFGNYIDGQREKIWNYFYENQELKAQAYYRSDAGLYKEFHPSGNLKMEGVNAAGKSEGVWRYYYESGELEAEGTFNGGYKDEEWKFYHKNGQLASKGTYSKGVASDIWEEYYEDGALASKGLKREGKKEGHWELYYESGKMKGVEDFSDGEGQIINYHENGTIRSEGYSLNDKKTSNWKYYDAKGDLEGTAIFKDGEGQYTGLYPNGEIKMRGVIRDNKRVGRWELFNEDGSLAGYYHPIYEKEPPAYVTSTAPGSVKKYDKPNFQFRKQRARYFQPVVNEYKGVIIGANPLLSLVGKFPISLEYYIQERIGYELQYTYQSDPFFKSDSDIPINKVFKRGASIELKQKFYSPDTQYGMLYFGHLIRFSNEAWFANVIEDGLRATEKLDTRRLEYGVIIGNRWMKNSGNSSASIDVYFGFGVGFRNVQKGDVVLEHEGVFSKVNTNPVSIPIIFGLNFGFSAPRRRAF